MNGEKHVPNMQSTISMSTLIWYSYTSVLMPWLDCCEYSWNCVGNIVSTLYLLTPNIVFDIYMHIIFANSNIVFDIYMNDTGACSVINVEKPSLLPYLETQICEVFWFNTIIKTQHRLYPIIPPEWMIQYEYVWAGIDTVVSLTVYLIGLTQWHYLHDMGYMTRC